MTLLLLKVLYRFAPGGIPRPVGPLGPTNSPDDDGILSKMWAVFLIFALGIAAGLVAAGVVALPLWLVGLNPKENDVTRGIVGIVGSGAGIAVIAWAFYRWWGG
jgi:hypothetical protein